MSSNSNFFLIQILFTLNFFFVIYRVHTELLYRNITKQENTSVIMTNFCLKQREKIKRS